MLNKETIIKTLRGHQAEIRCFGVKRLGLFGSFARGEQKASSDLDFVVELEAKTFDAYMGLKNFLEELFGCHVDLVLQDAIKPRLKAQIMQEMVNAA
ncbi:MAG TPA: nucleotidyltransferase family protein [bacterium]|nr:nucleotidyltransferase family protein [bacterium]